MKRINTIETKDIAKTVENGGCGECQTSCQSACKTSCGVANQQCVIFNDLALHIFKIHGISAVFILQGIFHHPAAVAIDHIEELVVHRGLPRYRFR